MGIHFTFLARFEQSVNNDDIIIIDCF